MGKTPARPAHFELGAAVIPRPTGYAPRHIILSLTPDTISAPAKILFTMIQVGGSDIIMKDKDYAYIIIEKNIELTIELASGIDWEWDWDSNTSGPITCKNEMVADYFYDVRGGAGDNKVTLYIKHNATTSTDPKDYRFEFNFHVVLGQTRSGKLKITIDPQVDNPPNGYPILHPTSVFALSE